MGLGAVGSAGKAAGQFIFNQIDSNHNGRVSKDELVGFQNKLQSKGIKTPFLNTLIQNFDQLNKDGQGIAQDNLAKSVLGAAGKAAIGLVGSQVLGAVAGGAASHFLSQGNLNKIEGLVGKGLDQLFTKGHHLDSSFTLKV